MLTKSDIYHPALVARLCRVAIPGPPSTHPERGIHISSKRGASLEFSEHTEYSPGDDLKHLDWKVFAKTDRFYVRRFEDERLSRSMIILDASNSTTYGGDDEGRNSKYHLAAKVAVALAACLVSQGDSVGFYHLGEQRTYLAPRSGQIQLNAVIEVAGNAQVGGRADIPQALAHVAERLGRDAAIYVVSDFLDEDCEDLAHVGLLRARGFWPRLIQVLHEDETSLPFDRISKFIDLEASSELALDPEGIRKAYMDEMYKYIKGLSQKAQGMGVPFVLVQNIEDAQNRLPGLIRRGA